MSTPQVLYEDNHVLAVQKPVNMPCQADASGDLDLLTYLKSYLKEKYNKPGAVYLGLVHRLDRPVGGVMVFAKTSKAAARLSQQIRENQANKTYYAVVQGTVLPPHARLTDYISKDVRTNTSSVCSAQQGGKFAALSYQRIGVNAGLSLLRITLETGRSHQIRVQMAHAGYPLWGDWRYGNAKHGQQIALWCTQMTVLHPTLKTMLTFTCLPPQQQPWSLFALEA